MRIKYFVMVIFFVLSIAISAQEEEKEKKDPMSSESFPGLKWRSVGPALTSGRISDFAVNPKNFSEYYVAVGSGHVWKTTNSGNTYSPVFDNYGAYAIGCVVMDPTYTNIIWVGTGENNHQRALGYGNGVYKSVDGGASFTNMGLKESRQIGGIVVHPKNSNTVFVAAEGSVWGPGGDRGLYKSIDGGKNWKKVLNISENTGVNNIVIDPSNPDILYATSEQRRRHVFTKIGGGPESAVYKSLDCGETWEKIMNGLPKVDIGGMGIAVSPANPNYVYLIMEAAEKKGGFFRSTNKGVTWEKMSDHTEAGQYYNEIYCDPVNVNRVYSVETISQVTNDGGKSWQSIGNNSRHVDDHALWINPENTDHFLIGGDGGIYETFDLGKNFYYKSNLPITQFYRVFTDNSLPFYYIYGGTQDNNSLGGPSRTISYDGIVNSDWFVTNGGDGFWSAVDPENPNIVYAESQYGGMIRYDRQSGEQLSIRPEPGKDELTFKWNWDTPLFISPHKNTRLYCAANKVFRSDDRGDSWVSISEDLTAGIDRNSWKVMGKFWSTDAVAKDRSTSLYGTIISLSESPVKENLLYAGTDDGLIQVTDDQKNWTKISTFPGIPENTYVSDILPSKFDENIVYASFNNTLRDDFNPYILISKDKGKSWKSISGDLPKNGAVHSIEQDFVNPKLLFAGTEFGFFFSVDEGEHWIQLKSGLPDISVKDISIQKRENDIVIATFGRGFYVLDNYSPLRLVNKDFFNKEADIFPIKDALMYIQKGGTYGQGSGFYKAPNPDYGAVFTYYLKDVPKTKKSIRMEAEKKLFKDSKPIPQPTEAELKEEADEIEPYLLFSITDESGNAVRKLTKSASKGIQRINWDLLYSGFFPIEVKDKFSATKSTGSSTLVLPGKYLVTMSLVTHDSIKTLVKDKEFNTVVLRNTTLPAPERDKLVSFQKKASETARKIIGTESYLDELISKTEAIKQTILNTPAAPFELMKNAMDIQKELRNIKDRFTRNSSKPSTEENPPSPVTLNERLETLVYTHWRTTTNITKNEETALAALMDEFPQEYEKIRSISENKIKSLESKLESLNAPYTPGRLPNK